MRKKSYILTRLLLLFLTIALVDGGKCILFADNKIHQIITHESHDDSEVPVYNHHYVCDDVKWVDAASDKTDLTFLPIPKIRSEFSLKTRDFSLSVWQPPKSC